jgi:hypothetical protein
MIGCGTLGDGFGEWNFSVSRKKLEIAIDSLYKIHPEYSIPQKWEKQNDWSERGYDFLESRIFYFKSSPEEMYYVTFIGDSATLANPSNVNIGIRSVFKENTHKQWLLSDDLNSPEKERIENRFDSEIIPKLEEYTKTKVSR